MREVRSAFVQLEPANHAMVGQIFCDARLRDSEMLGEARFDGVAAAPARAAAQQVADGDAQGLTRLDVVVGGEVGIAQQENARAYGSVIGVVELRRRAGQKPAKLHLEKRDARGKSRIAIAPFRADGTRFS